MATVSKRDFFGYNLRELYFAAVYLLKTTGEANREYECDFIVNLFTNNGCSIIHGSVACCFVQGHCRHQIRLI